MQPNFINNVYDSAVVGVDVNVLLGPFMPPKNYCYDYWVHFAVGGARGER